VSVGNECPGWTERTLCCVALLVHVEEEAGRYLRHLLRTMTFPMPGGGPFMAPAAMVVDVDSWWRERNGILTVWYCTAHCTLQRRRTTDRRCTLNVGKKKNDEHVDYVRTTYSTLSSDDTAQAQRRKLNRARNSPCSMQSVYVQSQVAFHTHSISIIRACHLTFSQNIIHYIDNHVGTSQEGKEEARESSDSS
jgi:hypothetical protein